MCRMLICRNCRRPKIVIEHSLGVRFDPRRKIWQLSIYNEKLKGLRKLICRRERITFCVEADFQVDNKTASLGNKVAFARWGDSYPYITLEPGSPPFEIELISKISGEDGFHIKTPSSETLLLAENVQVVVVIRTGKNEELIKVRYNISNKGKKWEHLDFIDTSQEIVYPSTKKVGGWNGGISGGTGKSYG